MRNLFSTRVKIILIVAALLTAGLAILSGITNTTIVDLAVKGALAPFRAAGTALTTAAENEVLEKRIAEMEDVARQADSVSRENERLRQALDLLATHEDYKLVDAYIIGWSSTDWENTLTINRGTSSGIQENMCHG